MVIDEVEDLDFAGVGQAPLGGIGLPELIRQLGLEADERSLGAFVRLRSDQAMALENAPDGDPGRSARKAAGQVMKDGLRTCVESGRRELGTELEDGLDDDRGRLRGDGNVGDEISALVRPVRRDGNERAVHRTSCARWGTHERVDSDSAYLGRPPRPETALAACRHLQWRSGIT